MRILLDYPWPGNVRELENSIEHATVLAKGDLIQVSDLPSALHKANSSAPAESHGTLLGNERMLLRKVLEECGWNKKKTAKRLEISRSSLYDKLKKYQITRPTTH
jgi:two-component system response regulator HydG